MRYILIFFGFIVVLIVIKQFAQSYTISHKKNISLPVVDVMKVQSIMIKKHLTASGVVKALNSVDITTDVPGRVTDILFLPGQFVHVGDTLLILDHTGITAEIQEEEAKYLYQKKNYHRFFELSKHDLISKDALDNLNSQLQQEIAKIHSLYAELDKRIIHAPFSGQLGLSDISVGQYIQTGEKIVNLSNNNILVLDLMIPAQYINTIFPGQIVGINSTNNSCGNIETIDTKIDIHTHSIGARVRLNNCHIKLVSGSLVSAYIFTSNNSYMTVAATALNYSMNGTSVFVVKNNQVHQTPIEAELNNDIAIIKNGKLRPGDLVVNLGQDKLFDNQKIILHMSQQK